jgi:hypothetical protein
MGHARSSGKIDIDICMMLSISHVACAWARALCGHVVVAQHVHVDWVLVTQDGAGDAGCPEKHIKAKKTWGLFCVLFGREVESKLHQHQSCTYGVCACSVHGWVMCGQLAHRKCSKPCR